MPDWGLLILLLLTPGLPLLLAGALAVPALRRSAMGLAPWAALPALAASLAVPAGTEATLDWLLFGARLGVDGPGRALLLATALLWLLGGAHAARRLAGDPRAPRFFGFFLAAAAGNLGVLLARDAVGLYLFYALMSLAAYGLVVHRGDALARQAGRIYISFAILGEVLVFFALVGLVASAGGIGLPLAWRQTPADWMVLLLLAGFGTKAGLLPVHGSLPVSYRVLPPAAGTVMAGAMLHAGLLGWMRLLPQGPLTPSALGPLLLAAGLAGAVFGVLVGLVQREPRALLAYSSMSQIGWMLVILGAGCMLPDGWIPALLLVSVYAVHHALAKGALFLAIDAAATRSARRLALAGLSIPALSIAGFPGTTGQLAKSGLKASVGALPEAWGAWLAWLLPVGAVGTALLMGRFLWLLWAAPEGAGERPSPWIWGALLVSSLTVPWVVAAHLVPGLVSFKAAGLWASLWPVALAGAIAAWIARSRPAALRAPVGAIRPGDLLWPVLRATRRLAQRLGALEIPSWRAPRVRAPRPVAQGTPMESALRRWHTAGLTFVALLLLSLALFWLPRSA